MMSTGASLSDDYTTDRCRISSLKGIFCEGIFVKGCRFSVVFRKIDFSFFFLQIKQHIIVLTFFSLEWKAIWFEIESKIVEVT